MNPLRKCHGFQEARQAMAEGIYPYFRPIGRTEGTTVQSGGWRLIMMGSNDYLSLTRHSQVLEAAREAVQRYGSASTGSPLLCGTLDIHVELETRLASFFRRQAALLFPTGYQAQLAVIAALAGKNDVVFCDRQSHASLMDGCRLSHAKVKKYRTGDAADLERLLAQTDDRSGKLIVTDGVFSMSGALAPLDQIVQLADRYDAAIILDDAHGLGVLGRHGRGAAEHFGVEGRVDLIAGTLSKSLASNGGFVVGDEPTIHYIRHHARPFIFSAGISAASAAAALSALDLLENEPQRRLNVLRNARFLADALKKAGFDMDCPKTAIVPVILQQRVRTALFCQSLLAEGVFSNAVISPAVPAGQDLIRLTCNAGHSTEQLEAVVDAFQRVGQATGAVQAVPCL